MGSPKRLSQPGLLEEFVRTVLSTVDMQEVLNRAGEMLRGRFGETRISIHGVVQDNPSLTEIVYVFDPKVPKEGVGRRVPLEGSLCGEAIQTRRPVAIDTIRPDRPRYHEERYIGPLGYGMLASFPLIVGDRVLGTLDIAQPPGPPILDRHGKEAEQIARILAIALNNSLLVGEVRRLNRLLRRENVALHQDVRRARAGIRYIAECPLMREVIRNVEIVAPSEATVFIRGETGTGKEGLARLVHDQSPRRDGPFVPINLGAVPEPLIESELFGHEKGAFTGALQRHEGHFETASGGTLFLDEVGDAPLSVQMRLMRVLEQREIQRVGASEPMPVNVRVIAATHRPIERMVEQGAFRSDLYYRLNIFPVHLPPLRERREDIRPLLEYFVGRYAAELHRPLPRLDEDFIHALETHSWPGNVRELENYVVRAMILTRGKTLERLPLPDEPAPVAAAGARTPRFHDAARALVIQALERTGGRIYGPRGAATLLGLKPTTLQGKMRKYGITGLGRTNPE